MTQLIRAAAALLLLCGPSWAGNGDGAKTADFIKVQMSSCNMGANPNNRFGCMDMFRPTTARP
jgi:hypothetical protein